MQRFVFMGILSAGVFASLVDSQAADRLARTGKPQAAAEQPLEVRVYPVADLVVPLPGVSSRQGEPIDTTCEQGFRGLEQHLRRVTGADVWDEETSIKPFAKKLALVVRQSSVVHARIAEEIGRLRRELDVQVVLEVHVITGPREEIASLAEAFPGELGQFETEQLRTRAKEMESVKTVFSPKITVFSRQTAQLTFDGRSIAAHAVVAPDHRSVELKVAEGPEKGNDILGHVELVRVHSGRSVALRFEAPTVGSIIPPAPDAIERLLVITPRVIIQEEEEQQVVITVTPRLIIQEEEEELLGIPVEPR